MVAKTQAQSNDFWLEQYDSLSQVVFDAQNLAPGDVYHSCVMDAATIAAIKEAADCERKLVRSLLVARHVPETKLNAIVNRIAARAPEGE